MPNVKSTTATAVSNETQHFAILVLFAIGLYLLSSPAFAIGSAIANVLCSAYGLIVFDIGQGLATLAIVALGVGAMLGRVTWGQAVTVGAGIGCVFGALSMALSLAPLSVLGIVAKYKCDITGTVASIVSLAP